MTNRHAAVTSSDHVYQNIVGFDVGMDNSGSLQKLERHKKLLTVRPHGFHVETNVFAVFLQNFAQIHAETIERMVEIFLSKRRTART